MLSQFLLLSKVSQPCPFGCPFRSGPHSALGGVACAVQWVLTSYLFIHVSVVSVRQSQSPSSSRPSPLPFGIHAFCPLYPCLYSCPTNRIIYTIFLDSTYMKYTIFLFLTDFTLYGTVQVLQASTNDPILFLFMAE